jgi:hypothetical protein
MSNEIWRGNLFFSMGMRETEFPGVGVRYDVQFEGVEALVVLIENEGTQR